MEDRPAMALMIKNQRKAGKAKVMQTSGMWQEELTALIALATKHPLTDDNMSWTPYCEFLSAVGQRKHLLQRSPN